MTSRTIVPARPRRDSVGEADTTVEAGRRVDVQHAHRAIAVVAEAVLDPRRGEDERARRRGHGLLAECERHLALDDVERVVLARVHVRFELAPGGDLDDAEREAGRVDGAGEELDVADAMTLARRDDDWLKLHRGILSGVAGGDVVEPELARAPAGGRGVVRRPPPGRGAPLE